MQGVRNWNRFNWSLMRANALEFAKRTGRTAYAVSKEMNMSDALLRGYGVNGDRWHPSMKTLERMEEFYEGEPEWPMNDSAGQIWRTTRGVEGSMTRRLHQNHEVELFSKHLAAWKRAKEHDYGIEAFDDFDDVSIIHAETKNPDEFFFKRLAPQTASVAGRDWTGEHLKDYDRPAYYKDAYFQDLCDVICRDRPTLSQLIWERLDQGSISYSFRLILPLQPYVLSCLWILGLETDLPTAFRKVTQLPT